MADHQQAPENDRPLVNIVGELVALGPLRRDLLPLYLRWINDFGTTRTLGIASGPITWEQEEAWFNRAATGESDVPFTIYERATWRPIGNTALHGVDYRNRTAEIGILIGEADARGKGYGTETIRLMLDYGFTALGLNNLMLRVFEYNLAAQRAYQKAPPDALPPSTPTTTDALTALVFLLMPRSFLLWTASRTASPT